MESHTSFPIVLIRAFDTLPRLNNFLIGRFRLSRIEYFKTIEDMNRRDETEGVAQYKVRETVKRVHISQGNKETRTTEANDDMNVSSKLGNPIYIFCASLSSGQSEISKKYGRFIARIEDPSMFARDVRAHLRAKGYRIAGEVRGVTVQYSKSNLMPEKLSPAANAELSYSQKPEECKGDNEFRFVAILLDGPSDNLPEHICIDLGKKVGYISYRL